MGHYYIQFILTGLWGLLIPILFISIVKRVNSPSACGDRKFARVPRTVPYTLPLLKSTIPFVFDGLNFFQYASSFSHDQSVIRVALLKTDLYLVQGPKHIAEVLRAPSLSVTNAYSIVLKHCFGMAAKAVSMYNADTSGSQWKPIEGSNVKPQNRISYLTHENLLKGLLGPGLGPTSDQFENAFVGSLNSLDISQEWVDFPDLLEFFEDRVGGPVITAIFGSTLLSQDPNFLRDLWAYDKVVIRLAKRLPEYWIPEAYRLRNKLLLSIKKWHALARAYYYTEKNTLDEDAISLWGSEMIQERYQMLLGVENQDRDSVASTDLGLLWATVTNVVPSSMTFALHIFRDSALLSEVRRSLANTIESGAPIKFNLHRLEKQPLLLSIYAETLRFGVQIHITRSAPHRNFGVSDMLVPKDKLILINTWLAHTNEAVWNTKKDAFPLTSFWAQHFLVDPQDPSSGPIKKTIRVPREDEPKGNSAEGVHFSTEGLEGAWIPYGGGQHACPGRILAKRIMLLACARMIMEFDIEILAAENMLRYASPRFGFGVRKPEGPIPFRIRRRKI